MRELRLLTELGRRADRIVSREELFELVWERPMRPGDRSVDVYVRKLRVKLETALPDWCFIHTHFGFGYRLAAEPRHAEPTGGMIAAPTASEASRERWQIPREPASGRNQPHRTWFRDELNRLEEQVMGGLDLVVSQLDRALEAINYQDVELAGMVAADDSRIDGRYVEVHQGVLSLLGRQALFLDDLRLRLGAAAQHPLHRADGRPVREHGQARAALRLRGAQGPDDPRVDREDGDLGAPGDPAGA